MAAWIRGKLLGAGAFGSVNLAMKRENGEVFAVKSVPMNTAGSEVAVQAIENEINILQDLNSSYVVRCLGSDRTVEESTGLVMRNAFLEYMPDGCLIDFVKQFGAALEDEHLLRTYTRSIVQGIDYLHSQGIVHCDIKGKNILVGNDAGAVKLTDFGCSKRVGGDLKKNCAPPKVSIGTPLWMAPEVVWQVEQTPASDIWSLGCTVVEMATGRAPWSNFPNQFAALYHIACTDELPEVPASLSAEAHDFLSHCFQRDPSKRWTSAQLLLHPFLTTRFAAPPSAPVSPISLMHFPAGSDSDASPRSAPVNSAAPSLLKRGLVSEVQEQMEPENWWSMPDNSGPWIVVRSPTSASTSSPSSATEFTPSIEGQDCAGNATAVAVSAVSPLLNASQCLKTSTSVEEVIGVSAFDADGIEVVATDAQEVGVSGYDANDMGIVAADAHVRCFAMPEMDLKLVGQDCVGNVTTIAVSPLLNASRCLESSEEVGVSAFDDIEVVATDAHDRYFAMKLTDRDVVFGNDARFFRRENFDESPGSTSLYIGRTEYIISEYSEQENVYSFSNPQILLYWLHRINSRDFECMKSGILMDEYTIIPVLQTNSSRICVCFLAFLCEILTCSLLRAPKLPLPSVCGSPNLFQGRFQPLVPALVHTLTNGLMHKCTLVFGRSSNCVFGGGGGCGIFVLQINLVFGFFGNRRLHTLIALFMRIRDKNHLYLFLSHEVCAPITDCGT